MVGRVHRNSKSLKDGRLWQRKCEQNPVFRTKKNPRTRRHCKLRRREGTGIGRRRRR